MFEINQSDSLKPGDENGFGRIHGIQTTDRNAGDSSLVIICRSAEALSRPSLQQSFEADEDDRKYPIQTDSSSSLHIEDIYTKQSRRCPLGDQKPILIEDGSKTSPVFFVKTLTGTTISLEYEASRSIRQVKESIRKTKGIPLGQHALLFQRKRLNDAQCLSECGIQENDTIHSLVSLRGGMQIVIRGVDGHSYALDVEPSETIEAIKSKIQGRDNIQSDRRRLIYTGTQLENGRTLADYNIQNEATIHLVLPVREDYLSVSSSAVCMKKSSEISTPQSQTGDKSVSA